MNDLILIAVLLMIVGAATVYIIKEKKRGVKCIGCPSAAECASRGHGEEVSVCGGSCRGCAMSKSGCSGKCGGCHGDSKQ